LKSKRRAYKLAVDIFNEFNYINHFNFNITELHESVKSNMYYLLTDKSVLINMLESEILDSNNENKIAKKILQEVILF
jgi:hypothetical protein